MQFRCPCGKELFVPPTVQTAQMRCPACGEIFINPNSKQTTAVSNSASAKSKQSRQATVASNYHSQPANRQGNESYWNSPANSGSNSSSLISTRAMLIILAIPVGVLAFGLVGIMAYWGLGRLNLELDPRSQSKELSRPNLPDFDATMVKIRNLGLPTTLAELETQYRSRPGNDQTARWLQLLETAGQIDLTSENLIRMDPNCGRIDESITPAHGGSVMRVSERHAGLIEKVDQMTQSPFMVSYPITEDPALSANIREIRSAEKVARLMFLDAYHQIFEGQEVTAGQRLLSGLRIAATVEQYPNDIATIYHYSMISNAKSLLTHMLQSNRLDEFQLVSFDHEFRKVLANDSSKACLSGNLVVGLAGFRAPEATLKYLLDVSVEKVWDEKTALADLNRNIEYDRSYFVDRIFSRFNVLNDRARQRQLISAEKQDATDVQLSRLGNLSLTPLDIASSFRWATWYEADTARTLIALERFRRANQTLPATLQQLVPQFLDNVPTDYFSNSPMGYAPQTDRYSLYSQAEQSVPSWQHFPKIWLRTTVFLNSSPRTNVPAFNRKPPTPGDGVDMLLRGAERDARENAEKSLQMQREHEQRNQPRK